MIYFVAMATVTLFLVFALLLLLLGRRSPESSRLMEVTTGGQTSSRPMEGLRVGPIIDAERVAKALGPLGRLLGSTRDSETVRRMTMAGYRKSSHVDIYYGVRVILPIAAGVTAFFLIKENTIFWTGIIAAVAFMLPDLWLTHVISNRKDRIRLSLPDALDLLVICMEAGLGLDQATMRVAQELRIRHPDLCDEFNLVNLEQRAGKPRIEAWRNMADRTGVESIRQFVHMLVQTERFGTPVSKSLGAFADALRVKRRQQAEEMAAKTTVKLIFPLAFFIFPTLFIVLLAPAIIIMRNMSKAFSE